MENWYDCLENSESTNNKVSSNSQGHTPKDTRVSAPNTGVDSFLSDGDETQEEAIVGGDKKASDEDVQQGRIRVASVTQLDGFTRVSSNTLVRMSEKDLWEIKEDEEGEYVVERLFDDDGNPLEV